MTKLMTGVYLMFKLISQRIDLDPDLVLVMWRNRPAIEIYEPGLSGRQRKKIKISPYPLDVTAGYPVITPFKWTYTGRPSRL